MSMTAFVTRKTVCASHLQAMMRLFVEGELFESKSPATCVEAESSEPNRAGQCASSTIDGVRKEAWE